MENAYPRKENFSLPIQAGNNQPASNAVPVIASKEKDKKLKKPVDWVRVFALIFAGGIVIGHAVLVWYDCWLLWKTPGMIAGLVVVLTIGLGLLAMASKIKQEVIENVTWLVWLLEGAAIFVHVPSFTSNAKEAYLRGLGELHTWLLAGIICLCSIAATYFYKETIVLNGKTDKK